MMSQFAGHNRFAEAAEEFNEFEIDFADELEEGEMRSLKVGPKNDDKVLIAKYKGVFRSVGNFCSHYGLPLSDSVLFDDMVLCKFHNAAFSIITGFPERAPGLDALPVFEVFQKDGKHFVKVPVDRPRSVTMPMAKRDPANSEKFVIIGGGPAGLSCAETLRQSEFTGEVIILSKEDFLPYDRTLLSKMTTKVDPVKVALRDQEFFDEHDIDIRLNS